MQQNRDTTLYTLHYADNQVVIAQDKQDLEYMSKKLVEELTGTGGGGIGAGSFLLINNFTQTILDHEKSQQHISASLSYNSCLQGNTIDTLLKSEIDSKITFWRDVLHRIINVIITLVSCNLPLRGHDSDSGNFMAISRLLSNYDATLKELLLKAKGEIYYLSPTIQNEIISLPGTIVRNNFISEIKRAPFLTIILDTTQDLSKIDQLSVVFRYISVTENDDNVPKEIKICESFLGFIAVTDCSAAGLKTVILNLTKEYGIDLTKCRGQGYDGANVMSGVYGGLQTLIQEHAPNADYVHCAAHALNLVLTMLRDMFVKNRLFSII
nr:unnamed protein product [Callosobruchus analis]